MTGNNNYENAETKLQQHLDNIQIYIDSSNCRYASFQEEFLMVSDLDPYDLDKKTQSELFDCAYLLYSYASYIQDQVNDQKNIIDFCNNQLAILVAKHRNDYGFDKYTKHDAKEPIIIFENSYAGKLNELRVSAQARLQCLEGKVFELKKQGDVLMEKAKRK